MYTSRMLRNWSVLLLVLGISAGCGTTITEQVLPAETSSAGSQARVAQLLDRALKPGTPAEYAAITVTYKSLSSAELELFNTLRMQSENNRIQQKLAQSGGRVSQAQLTMVTQALQQVNSLRSDVNKLSLEMYGIPYNQVADSLVNKLLAQKARNYAIDMPNLEGVSEPSARVGEIMSCAEAAFPYIAHKINYGNLHWNYWGEKRTPGTSDCDYEFRYVHYNYNFDPKDWFADRLCDSFGNAILRRSNSTYTRLLMGKWRVLFWEGYPGLTSVDMYD